MTNHATRRTWSLAVLALSLAVMLVTATSALSDASASATSSSSTLCSGYVACNVGTFTSHGYQSHGATSYWTMYAGNNCTNYVAFVESTAYQVATPNFNLGNGGQWAAAALGHGVSVNKTPSVGSVAVWTGGASGMSSSGHVAIVEQVGPHDSYVVISQQHMIDTNGYDWVRLTPTPTSSQWESWPDDFIHFTADSAAPVPVTVTSSTTTTTTTTTPPSILVHVGAKLVVRARIALHLRAHRR